MDYLLIKGIVRELKITDGYEARNSSEKFQEEGPATAINSLAI